MNLVYPRSMTLTQVFLMATFPLVWMPQAGAGGNKEGHYYRGGLRDIDLSSSTPHDDTRVVVDVEGVVSVNASLANSYSVGNQCYCMGSLENSIGLYPVETPMGWMTVEDACAQLGEGPGSEGRPLYNDVQCGNGPPNVAIDEHLCPGRVDMGVDGCGYIGPKWHIGQAFVARQMDACQTEETDCTYLFFFPGKTMFVERSNHHGEKYCRSECVRASEVGWSVSRGWSCGTCS